MVENSLQSIITEFKKKEVELENSFLKLSSAVDSLNSKTEKSPSGNLPFLPSVPPTNVPETGKLAEQACDNIERNKPPNLPIENFHYLASIGVKTQYSYRSRCMGALIEKRFVIATAQCINKAKVNTVRVGFASTIDSEQMNMVENPIKKVHLHPKFSRYSRDNSYVALVELESELRYSALRFPICLFTSVSIPLNNADIYYADLDVTTKLIAGQVRARIVPYERCLTFGESNISPDLICTQIDNDTTSDVYTASNGPIVLMGNGIKTKHRLIAVDSKSEHRDDFYFSHQITKVYDNLDFIENIVWKDQ